MNPTINQLLKNSISKLYGTVKDKIAPEFHSAFSNLGAVPVQAAPSPTYNVRGTTVNDKELETLRNVLFAEVSNRPRPKQELEANVIANTAFNRIPQYAQKGENLNLFQVLSKPKQYQGYGSPEYERIVRNATTTVDKQKLDAIDTVIGNIKAGKFQDNTGGSVFYSHDPQGRIYYKEGKLYK